MDTVNTQGIGLGLLISNILASGLGRSNGEGLHIDSTEGKGSVFSFFLYNFEET